MTTGTRRGLDVTDLAAGLALAAVGIGILLLSMDFRPASSPGRDPSILPRAVAVVLTVSGLGIAAAGLRGRPRGRAAGTPAQPAAGTAEAAAEAPAGEPGAPAERTGAVGQVVGQPPAAVPVIAMVAAVAVYAGLAFSVGYLVSTVLFLVALPLALTTRRDRRALVTVALFAAGLTLVIHLAFVEFLRVPLPPTPLP